MTGSEPFMDGNQLVPRQNKFFEEFFMAVTGSDKTMGYILMHMPN